MQIVPTQQVESVPETETLHGNISDKLGVRAERIRVAFKNYKSLSPPPTMRAPCPEVDERRGTAFLVFNANSLNETSRKP